MAAKILIVEDDKSLRHVFKSMLATAGYFVETAENGQEGLIKLEKFQPNLILVDVVMPVMGGFDLLRNLKADLKIPVIVLTGLNDNKVEMEARLLGADDFIRKDDIHLTELLEKVKKALKIKK
jgi:CheY-like chemotaxis protein